MVPSLPRACEVKRRHPCRENDASDERRKFDFMEGYHKVFSQVKKGEACGSIAGNIPVHGVRGRRGKKGDQPPFRRPWVRSDWTTA